MSRASKARRAIHVAILAILVPSTALARAPGDGEPPALPAEATPDDLAAKAIRQFEKYYRNQNEHVRRAAVNGLVACNHEDAIEPLLRAVRDPAEAVRREAVDALAHKTEKWAVQEMVRELRRNRDDRVRLAILEALHTSRPPAALATTLSVARSAPLEVRIAAAELLAVLPSPDSQAVDQLVDLLDDDEPLLRLACVDSLGRRRAEGAGAIGPIADLLEDDPDWRVRAGCIDALVEIRARASIPPILDAMERETGRLADDCHQALVALTGNEFPGDPERWRSWWSRAGETFRVPTVEEIEAKRRRQARALLDYAPRKHDYRHFGIPTRSRRVLFLVDVSTSMADRVVLVTNDEARLARFRERYGDHDTKIELAREEMINTVATLAPCVRFNIVAYHTDLIRWNQRLTAASTANKHSAVKWLSRLTPSYVRSLAVQGPKGGRTNTYEALNEAFGLARRATTRTPRMKDHVVEADTVFFLTDGMPTTGTITDPGELLRYFDDWHRRSRIVFHTITFGHENEMLLRPISERSGGVYLVVNLD